MLAVAQYLHAVDEDITDAARIFHGLGIGGVIGDGLRIEHHDVGEAAHCKTATVLQLPVLRRQAAEAVDCFRQRHQVSITHIVAEESSHIAVGARMRAGLQEYTLRCGGLGIGTETGPCLLQAQFDVFLTHQEIRGIHARIILDDEIEDGVFRRGAALGDHVGQGLAGEGFQGFAAETDEQHLGIIACEFAQVFPTLGWPLHFRDHALADGGILEALDHGVMATGLHPRRQGGRQAGGAGRVGIHVCGDVHTFAACLIDACNCLRHFRPVARTGRLQVIGLGVLAGCAGDGDGFLQRGQELIGLAAHVGHIATAGFGRRLSKGNQLIGLGKECRRIDQRGTDAKRTFAHGCANQVLHARKLLGGRRDIVLAQFMNAHRGRPNKGCDVGRDAELLQVFEVFAERGPRNGKMKIALLLERLRTHGLGERAAGPALAEDLQGHALHRVGHASAIGDQGFRRPTEHVDEARCHRVTSRVNHRSCAGWRARRQQGDNTITIDRHIHRLRRCTAAVINRAVANQQIVVRRRRTCGCT